MIREHRAALGAAFLLGTIVGGWIGVSWSCDSVCDLNRSDSNLMTVVSGRLDEIEVDVSMLSDSVEKLGGTLLQIRTILESDAEAVAVRAPTHLDPEGRHKDVQGVWVDVLDPEVSLRLLERGLSPFDTDVAPKLRLVGESLREIRVRVSVEERSLQSELAEGRMESPEYGRRMNELAIRSAADREAALRAFERDIGG